MIQQRLPPQLGVLKNSPYQPVRVKFRSVQFEAQESILVELEDATAYLSALKTKIKYDNLVRMTCQQDTLYQTVSHEMRTPLNGIQHSVSLLLKPNSGLGDDPCVRENLRLIYFQSNLLECFVNDHLDLKMI